MQRVAVAQRPTLAETALAHGYTPDASGAVPYWDETAYYRFTLDQIERDLEDPSETVDALCFELLDRAVSDDTVFRRLRIPEAYWRYIAESWRDREKDLMGRFDFSYDGTGPAKLLEYNADTPTTLYEAAVFQWEWLEQSKALGSVAAEADQFCLIHESLLSALPKLALEGPLHFTCLDDMEDDRATVAYLEDIADEAGLDRIFVPIDQVGVDPAGRFTDRDDRIIEAMYKLYPWEWLMDEAYGQFLPGCGVRFFEPPWKSVLSNKGMLALLWEMFEGHPNLLPAFFADDPRATALGADHVRKPLFSRRGANVAVVLGGADSEATEGPYGAEGSVLQQFHPLPKFDGRRPVMGCWMVAGRCAGLGIREDAGFITTENANFVPHIILD